MQLFQDLKYVGTDNKLKWYGSMPWHCTSFVSEYNTGEMKYCIQQPPTTMMVFLENIQI